MDRSIHLVVVEELVVEVAVRQPQRLRRHLKVNPSTFRGGIGAIRRHLVGASHVTFWRRWIVLVWATDGEVKSQG